MMRVLIVEDNERLASLIAALVTENGHAADVAEGVEAARTALSLIDYDVVLLDLALPDGDGRDVLNAIRQRTSGSYVLVITAQGDVVSRVQALNAGADDYIVKPFSDDELIARIRAVARRSRQISDEILTAGNVRLNTGSLILSIGDETIAVPRRELTVLSALLQQQGRVLRREKLEQTVYSFDSVVSTNAVEAAVSRLRKRLNKAGATIDITAMRGIGYILTERAKC
jgi:DNA-binding response OmpR family regulator